MKDINNIKAIVFDIDGTIIPKVSWQELTRFFGADVDKHIEIYSGASEGKIDPKDSIKQIINLWKQTGNNTEINVYKLANHIKFRNGLIKTIQALQEKYILCLISNSFYEYVKTIAQRLNIQDWYYNSKFYYDDKGFITNIDYSFDTKELKLDRFNTFIKKHNLKSDECAIVADSETESLLYDICGASFFIPSFLHPSIEYKTDYKLEKISDLLNYLHT